MSIEEKYKKKNMEVQQQVKNEFDNVKKGLSDKNIVQLDAILKELERTLNNKYGVSQ